MTRRFAALAASSLILLAACGADGDTTDTTVAAEETTTTAAAAEPGTIVEVAQSNADFSTLVSAVVAADLAETLSGEGPFTVFAPTNAAFAAIDPAVLEKLLLPENKATLAKILTFHVVAGKVMSADVTAGEVASVEGSPLTITTDGGVTVNGAKVTAVDVEASNGVIHVIDKVIIPPTVDLAAL